MISFLETMNRPPFAEWRDHEAVAVGVSGGPDSMALARVLSEWSQDASGPEVHALIVDHGLREESAQEAEIVQSWLTAMGNIKPVILRWEGEKPDAGIQEQARHARYGLMADYCEKNAIKGLFLAHHQDDQAETVLFRLAKGSGLDGLAGMQEVQDYEGRMALLRPFLGVEKQEILAYCEELEVPFVKDPSNQNEAFARVRLRNSMDVLAEEGLTAKRLAVTAKRLRRASLALEKIAQSVFDGCAKEKNTNQIVFKLKNLLESDDEIVLRVLILGNRHLHPDEPYLPRMEKLEALAANLRGTNFSKRTLGHVIYEVDQDKTTLVMSRE